MNERRQVEPGEVLELQVEKAVFRGLGLARHEGQIVFVPRAFPGDRVRARVLSRERGFLRAGIEELLEPTPARRDAPCPHAADCGGCAYQELGYEAQLGLKAEVVRESLARAGVPWAGELPIHGSPEAGWRVRARLHLLRRGARTRWGLLREGTHEVVPIDSCLQISERMNRAAKALAEAAGSMGGAARRIGAIELAESTDGKELVASLETDLPAGEVSRLSRLSGSVPWLTGLGAVGRTRAAHETYVSLAGEPWVHAACGELRLRHHVRSFFQGNRFLLEPLAQSVAAALPKGRPVLDLYSGVGLFALRLAREARLVRAAETSRSAFEDALANAATAGESRVAFERREVRHALADWPSEPGECVVLDPPRTGAGPQVVDAVAARGPEVVVYVSCDPPTLGRDLRRFADRGYRVDRLEAFDLFPDTFHVETIARLTPP
ncbi:MAG: 23S rRNA (uracil(1939)-C(5))-methyltransferase RlmD [Vicinamibacteria bacterium]